MRAQGMRHEGAWLLGGARGLACLPACLRPVCFLFLARRGAPGSAARSTPPAPRRCHLFTQAPTPSAGFVSFRLARRVRRVSSAPAARSLLLRCSISPGPPFSRSCFRPRPAGRREAARVPCPGPAALSPRPQAQGEAPVSSAGRLAWLEAPGRDPAGRPSGLWAMPACVKAKRPWGGGREVEARAAACKSGCNE